MLENLITQTLTLLDSVSQDRTMSSAVWLIHASRHDSVDRVTFDPDTMWFWGTAQSLWKGFGQFWVSVSSSASATTLINCRVFVANGLNHVKRTSVFWQQTPRFDHIHCQWVLSECLVQRKERKWRWNRNIICIFHLWFSWCIFSTSTVKICVLKFACRPPGLWTLML